MFKYILSPLLKIITTLANATTKGWVMLAKKVSPKVLEPIFICLTIAILLELFWFTTLATFWLFWNMMIAA